MEANGDWTRLLEEAIEAKGSFLEERELPRLKKQLSLYQTYFDNIFNILVRKSLVQEDPYKYDEKITEVSAPSRDEIHEADKKDRMRQRLSVFRAQMDYLNTYYEFNLDFLDLSRIRRILDLVNYLPWTNLTGSKGHSVSVILADYLRRINLGTDNMTSKILRDTTTQIANTMQFVLAVLKDLTVFQRERYKLEFRRNALPRLNGGDGDPAQALRAVKPLFQRLMPGASYYPELIREVLAEERGPGGAALREEVLRKLAIVEEKPRKPQKASSKTILLQAVRLLAAAGFQLEDVIGKLKDNHDAMMIRKVSLRTKLIRWLNSIFGGGRFEQIYDVEMFDNQHSTKTIVRIDFAQLMNDLQRKMKLFKTLSKEQSIASRQLSAASEEKIHSFLTRHLTSLQSLHRQLMGLNDHFKQALKGERTLRHRGLRVELAAIKNSLVKSNQKKHEYAAAREEQEQMEKLGAAPE